jgi:hypothetical protein
VRSLHALGIALVATQFVLFACATAEQQPGFDSGGSSDSVSGSTSSSAGASGSLSSTGGVSGTTQIGGSGTGNTAFGGSNGMPTGGAGNAAGTGSGGHAGASMGSGGTSGAGAGGKASGGTSSAGAGGKASAGAGGKASGGSSNGGTGGSSSTCLVGWQSSSCDTCSTQTQDDHKACSVVLQCYEDNGCNPTTCGQPDQKCGQNTLAMGTAAFPIATMVYNCRCPP